MSDEPEIRRGLVADAVAAEHPGLWLAWTEVEAAPAPTPRELRDRLRRMADRMTGAEAIAMRRREVPHAHRVFFRHIGLDPDVVRTPVEALVLRRMSEGGLGPQGLIADALNVAVLETGVGVWAFDGLVGAPRIEEDGGRLVLADDERAAGGPLRRSGARRRVEGHAPASRSWRSPCRASPTSTSRRRSGSPGTSCAEAAPANVNCGWVGELGCRPLRGLQTHGALTGICPFNAPGIRPRGRHPSLLTQPGLTFARPARPPAEARRPSSAPTEARQARTPPRGSGATNRNTTYSTAASTIATTKEMSTPANRESPRSSAVLRIGPSN